MPNDLPYWGYADPNLDAVDAVRFYIGDTDPADPLLADSEIQFTLSNNNNDPLRAAIEACGALASKFGTQSSYRIGQVSETFGQKAEAYERRAKALMQLLTTRGGSGPYAGGISVADKAARTADADSPTSIFTVGMQDNK